MGDYARLLRQRPVQRRYRKQSVRPLHLARQRTVPQQVGALGAGNLPPGHQQGIQLRRQDRAQLRPFARQPGIGIRDQRRNGHPAHEPHLVVRHGHGLPERRTFGHQIRAGVRSEQPALRQRDAAGQSGILRQRQHLLPQPLFRRHLLPDLRLVGLRLGEPLRTDVVVRSGLEPPQGEIPRRCGVDRRNAPHLVVGLQRPDHRQPLSSHHHVPL